MSSTPLVTLLSVAVLVTGLAYLRENRLRRALQRLLGQLLYRWRRPDHDSHDPSPDGGGDDVSAIDQPADRRL